LHILLEGDAVSIRRIVGNLIAIGTATLLVGGVAVAGTAQQVIDTPKNEFHATADDGYLAYVQSRAGKPNKVDVYLKPPAAPRIKVNAAGTTGFYSNIEIGDVAYGDRLVFAQRTSGNTELKIWDVGAGVRRNPPAGVNTSKVESKPSLSGQHLLFGRGPATGGGFMTRIVLYDFVTDQSSVLDTAPTNGIVFPGTVNGDWASWTECSPSDCRAWRYQISLEDKSEVPTSARLIYTSAAGQDGTVWYMQSGIGCGANVKLRRHNPGTGTAIIIGFPAGIDANVSDLDDTNPLARRLYFDRVRCSNVNNWAIWRADAD
jgi:hypothetical protein